MANEQPAPASETPELTKWKAQTDGARAQQQLDRSILEIYERKGVEHFTTSVIYGRANDERLTNYILAGNAVADALRKAEQRITQLEADVHDSDAARSAFQQMAMERRERAEAAEQKVASLTAQLETKNDFEKSQEVHGAARQPAVPRNPLPATDTVVFEPCADCGHSSREHGWDDYAGGWCTHPHGVVGSAQLFCPCDGWREAQVNQAW